MADKFYKPSKNKNTTTVRIIGQEPAWLAEIHKKEEMFKMAKKAQEE